MKKNLAILFGCVTLIILLLTACTTETTTTTVRYEQSTNAFNQFVLVERQYSMNWGTLYIVYDKDTKVMYYMRDGNSYTGGFTPIYNADGSVKVYDD